MKTSAVPILFRIGRLSALAFCAATFVVAPPIRAHELPSASRTRMLMAASEFVSALSAEQRQKAVFPADDPERKDWSNLPHTLHPRKGVSLGELSPEQRVKAHHLIQAGLSSQGYLKASGIMQLDEVLLHLSGQDKSDQPMFGLGLYWLSFLGEPSPDKPWGWQLDGHHLALNFQMVGHEVAMTPTFMGSDPHEVRDGPYAGWRVLGAEDDKGLALMKALTPEQRTKVMLSAEAPTDVITGPGRDKNLQHTEGLAFSELDAAQKALLITLVEEYINNYRPDLAQRRMDEIRGAGWEKVYFGWAGPTDISAPYYYRVHGPTLLIEFDNSYAPGRNAGPVNHIHSVFRDPQNDYGEDILKKHYEQSHSAVPQWPQFRGPNTSGVAEDAQPPVHFGPETNLLWKTTVPRGLSAPVVWGDRIFLTAHEDQQLITLACDARTGRELWRQLAPADRIEKCHEFSSPAAPTPCTDGERVYAYFGSFGLIAYDFAGKELWRRPLERLPSQYGTATSPILAGGQLILQHDGDSTNAQLIAIAPATGKTLWTSPRPLAGASYSTPTVWRHDGIEELIVQGKGRVAGYSLTGGPQKWWVRGWGFAAVTTPVAGDGMLFAGGSGMGDPAEPADPIFNWKKLLADHDANKDGQLAIDEVPESLAWHIRKEVPKEVPGNMLRMRDLMSWFTDTNKDGIITKGEWDADEAYVKDKFNADRFVGIRPGGKDDSTTSHVAWETTKGLSEMPSPLFYRGRVHFIRDGGMWTVLEPRSGKRLLDRERVGVGGQFVASPIAANGYIYVVNESGTFAVLRAGDTLEIAAVNRLGENVRATPAIAGRALYVRGMEHLWAFAQ